MRAINKILEELNAGEGKKTKVIILNEENNSENDSEKTEVTKVTIKDSTRAAKLAKIRIMISVYDQIKGLSAEETGDVLGAVCELIDHSGKMIALDEDLGRFFIKKGEKATREILAKLEKDEPAGD